MGNRWIVAKGWPGNRPNSGGRPALRLAKRAFHKPLIAEISAALDQENLGLNQSFGSEDFFEALSARMEKRHRGFRGNKSKLLLILTHFYCGFVFGKMLKTVQLSDRLSGPCLSSRFSS